MLSFIFEIILWGALKRVYGQFCIETLHESRIRKSNGLNSEMAMRSVLLIRIGKQNVKIIDK